MRMSKILTISAAAGKEYINDTIGSREPEGIDSEEQAYIDGMYKGYCDGYRSGMSKVYDAFIKSFNEICAEDSENGICRDYKDLYDLRDKILSKI